MVHQTVELNLVNLVISSGTVTRVGQGLIDKYSYSSTVRYDEQETGRLRNKEQTTSLTWLLMSNYTCVQVKGVENHWTDLIGR